MAVMDTVTNSTLPKVDDNPPGGELSPTTLILNHLKARGVPITPDNIRRAVIENARGNLSGPDPVAGLRSDAPSQDSGPGVGQRGNVANKVEGGGRGSNAPVNLGGNPYGEDQGGPTEGGTKQTSAAPYNGPSASDVALSVLLGGGPGLAVGMRNLYNRATQGEFVGNKPMPPTGRMTDVPIEPQIAAGPADLGLPGPSGVAQPQPDPVASPTEAAMQKALAPPGPQPSDVETRLPPGVSEVDAARAATGDMGRPDIRTLLEPPPTVTGPAPIPPSSAPRGVRTVPGANTNQNISIIPLLKRFRLY